MTSTTMYQVNFRPFCRGDLAGYAAWFADAELADRVGFPDKHWFDHVLGGCNEAHAVVALTTAEDEPLAVLQYDEEPDGGINLLIAIDPARRGQGFGLRVLAAFIEHVGNRYAHIDGHVEVDNLASIACLERCGFVRQRNEPDDGFLFYRKLLGTET